ncbi:MAG: SpoIID/LytB domain-containing protein [Tissierellia bacterium]|nr:SpoIID/LytB domain-containing protein [Tissierellia bacterium]
MKRLISILIIFILTLGFIPVDKAYGETIDYYIDVKLTRPLVQNDYVNLTSTNGFIIYDKEDKENPLFSIEDTSIKAMPNNGHIDLMDSANNILYSLPSDGSLIIGPNNLEEPIITVEKDSYRGYIRLFINDGELIVINHVYLEDYLYGVVPREMSYTSPMEALKAQAVASRSFAMHNINKHAQEGFNLCDTTHCQAYAGYIYERSSTNQAVDETMGVLIYYEGEVIEAIYHSTSSGYTEDSSNVWGGSIPYLKSVEDHFSLDSPHNNWSFSIKLSDLNEKIIGAGINIGELQNIEIIETTSTNKVKNVKLIGSLGEEIITGERFRNIIGTTTLKSAWFRIKDSTSNTVNYAYVLDGNSLEPKVIDISKAQIIDGNNRRTVTRSAVVRATGNDRIRNFQQRSLISGEELVIEGSGYGHGVGMSQYGAKKMAEYGYTFEEILKYYYTGVDVF